MNSFLQYLSHELQMGTLFLHWICASAFDCNQENHQSGAFSDAMADLAKWALWVREKKRIRETKKGTRDPGSGISICYLFVDVTASLNSVNVCPQGDLHIPYPQVCLLLASWCWQLQISYLTFSWRGSSLHFPTIWVNTNSSQSVAFVRFGYFILKVSQGTSWLFQICSPSDIHICAYVPSYYVHMCLLTFISSSCAVSIKEYFYYTAVHVCVCSLSRV